MIFYNEFECHLYSGIESKIIEEDANPCGIKSNQQPDPFTLS
jgi:hypothetical protein